MLCNSAKTKRVKQEIKEKNKSKLVDDDFYSPLMRSALAHSFLLSPSLRLACNFVLWPLRYIRQFPVKLTRFTVK